MTIQLRKTERGFMRGEFVELYRAECSIQESSLADQSAIWLGVDEVKPKQLVYGEGWKEIELPPGALCSGRMHLNQAQVAALLPLLQHFAEHGELPRDGA